jgi:hypothetical protein
MVTARASRMLGALVTSALGALALGSGPAGAAGRTPVVLFPGYTRTRSG